MAHVRRAVSVFAVLGWTWLLALTTLGFLGYEVRRHHFEAAGLFFGFTFATVAWQHRYRFPRDERGGSQDSSDHFRLKPEATWRMVDFRWDGGRIPVWVYIVPAAIAAGAFAWAVRLGPLSDDFVLRHWALTGQWAPRGWEYFRPIPIALWQAVYSLAGWPALHVLNVSLHALNSALVARIGATWLGPLAGIVAGVVFALFPTATEPVAWNAGIFDLSATACVLTAVTIWLSQARPLVRGSFVVLACVAGLLCKESTVALPALLFLLALLCWPALTRDRVVAALTTLALGASYVVIRGLVSASVGIHVQHFPVSRRQLKDVLAGPFSGLTVPMRTDGGVGADVHVAALLLLVVIAAVLVHIIRANSGSPHADRRATVVFLGLAWTLLSAAPLLLRFHVSPSLEGSRFLYLPSAGFALLLSAAFAGRRVGWRDGAASVAVVALLAIYGVRLQGERAIWREAARLRDVLLAQAAAVVREVPCRTLTIEDRPDNVRGAVVFAAGMREAIADLPHDAAGQECVYRWTGTALVPADPR